MPEPYYDAGDDFEEGDPYVFVLAVIAAGGIVVAALVGLAVLVQSVTVWL